MNKNNVIRKGLVITIIVLFVGMCIPSSIIGVEETAPSFDGDIQPPITMIEFGKPYYKESEGNIYITSDTPIYLNATDNESGVNATYYRINDGKWVKYAAPFSIPEDCDHAIYFYSVDNASNEESIKNKNVSVDNYPPYHVLSPPCPDGNNGWYKSSVFVSFADAKSGVLCAWYRVDGGLYKLYYDPIRIGGDGYHTVDYFAFDNVGNEGTGSFSIKIDQTPPTTTHEFDGILDENGWYVSDVIVTLSAEDETSGVDYTMYKIDDGEWTTYTDPFVVTEDGEHTLYYYSVDLAGNKEDVNEVSFKIDQTSPTIEDFIIEKIDLNTWLFTAIVNDETSGIAKVEFYVDDEYVGTVTESPYEWEHSGTAHGVQIIVYDNAGNEAISILYPVRLTRVFGIIRNPEFTEETVSLFTIVVISNNCPPYVLQQLTFQNNYSGYIGRLFINAVFKYGPEFL